MYKYDDKFKWKTVPKLYLKKYQVHSDKDIKTIQNKSQIIGLTKNINDPSIDTLNEKYMDEQVDNLIKIYNNNDNDNDNDNDNNKTYIKYGNHKNKISNYKLAIAQKWNYNEVRNAIKGEGLSRNEISDIWQSIKYEQKKQSNL